MTIAETAVVLALLVLVVSIIVPTASSMASSARGAAAAREMALALHALRWKSVAANRSHGLWFQQDAEGWHWFVVRDGNGNGLRTAELRSGTDRTLSGPHRLEHSVEGMLVGFPDQVSLPSIPPRGGRIRAMDDPVQFGRSDLISFSPMGTSSSGTLYLTDNRHELRAVVLFGPSARVRVWRYDLREGRWRL